VEIRVRAACAEDAPLLYEMVRESAIEQGGEDALCVTPENMREDGFETVPPRFECAIAEVDGEPAGIALYFNMYSTWTSRNVTYLEDLYVRPQFRRHGIARALMEAVKPMKWVALRDNEAASRFYASMGAEPLEDWVLWKYLPGNELQPADE
jgi:GNAT superfamily N-acetyltransferase